MRPSLRLLRPRQWTKNAFVFAPLIFAHKILDPYAWYFTLIAAICFLCVSCMVYIVNDISDVEEDRHHPVKSKRPLAASEITILQAVLLACFFAGFAVFMLTALPIPCTEIAAIYLLMNLVYTFYLKRIAIIDIFFIASCYVLRVLMGCYALQVIISPWIILTTFFLALFLGFGKRYHELGFEDYAKYKPNLRQYNRALLDRLVAICGSATLMTYAIYTADMSEQMDDIGMVYTVAFVCFGLFRYLQSIYVYNEGGEPENVIIRDKLQVLNGVLWLVATICIVGT
jgi:4-hydroxybenzoate polyprenyltransferase